MSRPVQDNGGREPPGRIEATVAKALRHARRVVVAVIGGTLVLIGVVMLVTPGPAMVLIPLGLLVLAVEFAWARRLLRRVKAQLPERFRYDKQKNR